MSEDYTFSPIQFDVFREIGNIGAGNAATALASLLNRTVDMNVPNVKMLPISEIPYVLGGADKVAASGLIDLSGDIGGFLIFVLDIDYAHKIISLLCDVPESPVRDAAFFTELGASAITEIVNIIAGSFLSAISTFTGLTIVPSIPFLNIDMVGAILGIVSAEYGQTADHALFFETMFRDVTEDNDLSLGNVFLAPDHDSYQKMLTALGVSE